MASGKDMDFILKELEDVKRLCTQKVPDSELVACVPDLVRVKIKKTQHKQLAVLLHFSERYPETPVVVELKSKSLDDKLLDGLSLVCEQEAKKYLGDQQIILVLKFIRKFIDDNPLCICRGEISKIQKELISGDDELKLKQKTSQLAFKIVQDKYFFKFRINVPDDYPLTPVSVELEDQSFPDIFKVNFLGQATETARKCVQPPLKKNPKAPPFEPSPSLYPVAEFLIKDSVKKFPREVCPCCKERSLPEDPKDIITEETHDKHVERMYCGHIFHHGCLDKYLKTPPFTGGKKCPTCGNRIFHDKWKISPELAEVRWAHKEARLRELDEVVDFLK